MAVRRRLFGYRHIPRRRFSQGKIGIIERRALRLIRGRMLVQPSGGIYDRCFLGFPFSGFFDRNFIGRWCGVITQRRNRRLGSEHRSLRWNLGD
jgi:hypothetical protein